MAQSETNILLTGDAKGLTNSVRRAGSEVDKFSNKAGSRLRRFGQRASASFRRVGTSVRGLGLGGIVGGLAFAKVAKDIIDFDARLARLAIQANISKGRMGALKNEIFEVSKATGRAPTDLLEGIDAIVQRTGNFKFAVASLREMAIVGAATGTRMEDIGATASNLQEKLGIASDEILKSFDILSNQGKKGSFTLANMASQFERLLSAAQRMGITGVSGLRNFGAFLQIARRGAGSSEQAATAVERVISNIIEQSDKIKKLTGFDIFDAERTKRAGKPVIKEFSLILKEIITRTGGNVKTLGKIFGEQAIRAITPLAAKGAIEDMERLAKVGGDGSSILKDFAFWSEQSAANIEKLKSSASEFANVNMKQPIDLMNQALTFLNEHPIWTNKLFLGLLGLGGVKLAAGLLGLPATLVVGGAVAAATGGQAAAQRQAVTGVRGGLLGANPFEIQTDIIERMIRALGIEIPKALENAKTDIKINVTPNQVTVDTNRRNTVTNTSSTNTGSLR